MDKVKKNESITKTPVHSGQSKKIYESIIKTPVHSGQGTCTESITMQFPRFKNKPRVILFFITNQYTMLCCFYVLLPVKLLVDISNNAMETCVKCHPL